jgi:hypothetical protein
MHLFVFNWTIDSQSTNLLDVIFCEPWCKHWQVTKCVLRPTLEEGPGSNFLGTNLD